MRYLLPLTRNTMRSAPTIPAFEKASLTWDGELQPARSTARNHSLSHCSTSGYRTQNSRSFFMEMTCMVGFHGYHARTIVICSRLTIKHFGHDLLLPNLQERRRSVEP